VIVTLKADTGNENYSKYLDEYQLHSLVKKYSNYIRYPIQMMVTKSRKKEGTEDEYEDYKDLETLNDMSPIWKKQKSEVTDEEYSQFYNQNFYDFNPPLKIIRSSTEGAATYTALLFIPSKAPFNYFSSDYKKGLKLYASGVLIMDSCEDLLPDFFNFVRGLVDSEDLSLNISREMLQQDHQVKVIERVLEKKIKNELLTMLRNEREKYETFFGEFGSQLKFGSYVDYGRNKELLQDLLLFYTSSEGKLSTLDEYVDRMREEQKYIYYACGESIEKIRQLPQVERLQDKGYEMLYCTEDLDEFTLKTMRSYKDKEFRSVSDDDLGIDTEEEKAEARKADEENKELFDFMKEALDGKVVAVRATTRLKSHPVFLSSEGGLSIDMEKVLAQQANPDNRIKAMKVLEINAGHPIFEKMKSLYAEGDKDKVTLYSKLLFGQALLMEGLNVDDPVAFANDICELM
ncbi:MAG: molecular chaperone HtpG, partial [Clostridia bacterium]|nr:molecular chaperone HtpG [Clostridia bacterium]